MWKRGLWAAAVTSALLAFALTKAQEMIHGHKLLSGWFTPEGDPDGETGLQQGNMEKP